MMKAMPTLKSRFEGCLLGLAIGDALGGKFEGQRGEVVRMRVATVKQLVDYPREEIWYTDDTQMTIGVAEELVAHGAITQKGLVERFVANYDSERGYGRGARRVLEAMAAGQDHQAIAEQYFPGGSYGNGAAMRVAPVGLFFRHDRSQLWEAARASALPTHVHPLGIEGAQLIALATALCVTMEQFDREAFLGQLISACQSEPYREKFELALTVKTPTDLAELGNQIEALHSAPTAIASFTLTPDSYEETIANVIFLGGDTDTLAAMAGALSGAYLGIDALPSRLVDLLERTPIGRDYLLHLAKQLLDRSSQTEVAADP